MSGRSGGNDPPPPARPCKELQALTTLNSPDPQILKEIKVNDCLTVKAHTIGKQKILAAFRGQEVAGSITDAMAERFLDCIAKGFKYKATVIAIKGGRCEISIELGTCK